MLKRLATILSLIVIVVALDQYTKYWAVAALQNQPTRSYLGGSFLLLYAENTGAWGSMGSNLSDNMRFWILTVMPFVFLGGLSWYTAVSKELKPYMVACYALVIGGGLGNLIDRALYGYVVDFLWTGIPDGIGTNIYNIADVAIMLGVITLLVMHFIYERGHAVQASHDQNH
ncbi:MAG: signal peptidase II [Proteobacteria bacterium]|nr:signal peptidase II [Pseudomonadota bacterium]